MSNNPFDRNKTKEARLGQLITEPGEQNQRDAVHIAVAPVIAGTILTPGQRVGVSDDGRQTRHSGAPVGIVDPFLTANVKQGETFWLFLFQGSVNTLRHEWTHDAFPSSATPSTEDPVAKAKAIIQGIAADMDVGYETLMEGANEWAASRAKGEWGEYITQYDSDSWRDQFPSHAENFWKAWEVITGKKHGDHSDSFFSCSC